ncbi:hypothetical protein PCL_00022 [Purpureocillium lilacinum]|uniref:Uncharacterized protein n=1 Tax=Purpureocillium lilacinum TaxID=33203 RepID=A0A2U3DP77_PURLI|nr:hypothetical protein PCL_00022 [Purpureocillium lilacinum]
MSTASYSVTILNRSGETQSYILLGGSNVLAKIIDVPSPHGNAKYDVTDPNVMYYVSTGDYEVGTAVDLSESPPFAMIDFTKAKTGQTMAAAVTHNKDGTFSSFEI